MADETLQVQMRDPRSLTPYTKNHKKHSQTEIEKLAGLIDAFGFDQPIVVDGDGVIIKGHKRREAALQLGKKLVPVVVSTKDAYQNQANRIADNFSVTTEVDEDVLRFELGTLARNGQNLQLTGIPTGKLELLTAPLELHGVTPQVVGSPPASALREPPPGPGQAHYISPDALGLEADGSEEPEEGYDERRHPRGEAGQYRDKDLNDYPPGAPPPDKMSADTPADAKARVGLGSPVVQYNLIFDDEAQQQRWYAFSKWLRATYPEPETLAGRLDLFLEEHLAEAAEAVPSV